VSEAIDPADKTEDQFNRWYRQTYINEISQIRGWRRTSRFDTGIGSGPRNGNLPRWLALHEFEEWSLDNATTLSSLLGKSKSKETKDIEASAKKIDMTIWKLMRVYGDPVAPWGLPGEDKLIA
jgi:hypothetical protein